MADTSSMDYGLALSDLAAAKGFDAEELKRYGVRDGVAGSGSGRTPCVDIPYLDAHKEVTATHKRIALDGDDRFRWKLGGKTSPYGLWRLDRAHELGWVMLVEGETDCWTSWKYDLPCLGLPGASNWRSEYAELLEGLEVWVWREPGEAGAGMVERIGADVPSIRVIDAPEDAKDISDLHLQDPSQVAARIEELKRLAIPFSRLQDAETTLLIEKAKARAKDLLASDDLLQLLRRDITASGYAGDTRPALAAYTSINSRLLDKFDSRFNVAYVSQSASGKNAAVDAARQFFPDGAYYLIRAGSPRSLIYNDESFEYRAVIAFEADSLPEDGPAASAVRSLVSDGILEYEVTEKDPEGGFYVRKITKPGPTPLVTTSTKPLKDQGATRVLTITIPDTPEQTAAIMEVQAERAEGAIPALDFDPWLALQEYLGLLAPIKVIVPFARKLAKMLPHTEVRMRRDFSQLVTAVKTLAALRQHQRARDEQGRIIADIQDYADARWLLEEVFASAVAGGVTAAIRETVDAVREIYARKGSSVRESELEAELGLSRSATQYRVKRALDGGWLDDGRLNNHQPRLLKPGAPLPDAQGLPDPSLLCADDPRFDSAVRQVEPSTASPSAAEDAEPSVAIVGTVPNHYDYAEGGVQSLPNGHSAGSTAPSSLGEQGAEGAEPDLEGSTHTEAQMPWAEFIDEVNHGIHG